MQTEQVENIGIVFTDAAEFLSDDQGAMNAMWLGVHFDCPVIVMGDELTCEFEEPRVILEALRNCLELVLRGGMSFYGPVGPILVSLQTISDQYEDTLDLLRTEGTVEHAIDIDGSFVMKVSDVESYIEILENVFG